MDVEIVLAGPGFGTSGTASPKNGVRLPTSGNGSACSMLRKATAGKLVAAFLSFLLLPLLALPSSPAAAQDVMPGERLFQQRCASCHTVQPGQNKIGPHLVGVLGREAGTVEGARYSAGMRSLGARWDEALLDRFLANPQQVVPGTSMGIGVPDAGQRRALVDYLKTKSN